MTETSLILNEEVIAIISTLIITVVGGYMAKFKSKSKEFADLIADINDAVYDDKVTAEEVKKISDSARKLSNR
jgi:hypothetical protein